MTGRSSSGASGFEQNRHRLRRRMDDVRRRHDNDGNRSSRVGLDSSWSTPQPSRHGMFTSRTTRDGGFRSIDRSAATPSDAVDTSKPSNRRPFDTVPGTIDRRPPPECVAASRANPPAVPLFQASYPFQGIGNTKHDAVEVELGRCRSGAGSFDVSNEGGNQPARIQRSHCAIHADDESGQRLRSRSTAQPGVDGGDGSLCGEDGAGAASCVETGGLFPSVAGHRVSLASGTFTVTDGPFAETKELIGGYAIVEVPRRRKPSASRANSCSCIGTCSAPATRANPRSAR